MCIIHSKRPWAGCDLRGFVPGVSEWSPFAWAIAAQRPQVKLMLADPC